MGSERPKARTEAADVEAVVGRRIREIREERGVSQSYLGHAVSYYGHDPIPQEMLSRAENGQRALRLNEAAALATALGVRLGDLLPPAHASVTDPVALARALRAAGVSVAFGDPAQAAAFGNPGQAAAPITTDEHGEDAR